MRRVLNFIVVGLLCTIGGCLPSKSCGAERLPQSTLTAPQVTLPPLPQSTLACPCHEGGVCVCKDGQCPCGASCSCPACPGKVADKATSSAGRWIGDGTGDFAWWVGSTCEGWYMARSGMFHRLENGVYKPGVPLPVRPSAAFRTFWNNPSMDRSCPGGRCL